MSPPIGSQTGDRSGAVTERGRAGRPGAESPRRVWFLLVAALGLGGALVLWTGTGERTAPLSDDAGPGGQVGHLMAFDPAGSRVLLLEAERPRDLWAFDLASGRWTLLAEGEASGSVPAMSYDTESRLLVVVGSDWVAETTTVRAYDPTTGAWEVKGGAPMYRDSWWSEGWMETAYDAGSDLIVAATDWGPLWTYDVDADRWNAALDPWSNAPPGLLEGLPASPPACLGWVTERPMAYDAGSDRIVVAGRGDLCLYDTDAGTMTVRRAGNGPRQVSAVAYDEGADRTVVIGDGATWTYHTGSDELQRRGPVPEGLRWRNAAMAYDGAAGRMVLYDGGATWILDPDTGAWIESGT